MPVTSNPGWDYPHGGASPTVVCPDCQRVSPAGTYRCPGCDFPLIVQRGAGRPATAPRGPWRKPDHVGGPDPVLMDRLAQPPPPQGTAPAPPLPSGAMCPQCRHTNPISRIRCERCAALLRAPAPAPTEPPPLPPEPRNGNRRALIALIVLGVVVAGLSTCVWLMLRGGQRVQQRKPPAATATVGHTVRVNPNLISVVASSTQKTDGVVNYRARNTLDGRADTAWNSNGEQPGSAATLTYAFAAPVDLRGISLLNGYQKTAPRSKVPDLYLANARIRSVRVITDAGQWTWNLKDEQPWQTLSQDLGRTRTVRLQVLSVYPGNHWRDVAVSEVSFIALG